MLHTVKHLVYNGMFLLGGCSMLVVAKHSHMLASTTCASPKRFKRQEQTSSNLRKLTVSFINNDLETADIGRA